MNIFGRKAGSAIKSLMLGLLYGLFAATPVVADDIEIYTGTIPSNSPSQSVANVLFIVDTSGSMSSMVVQATGTYDPAVVYAGCFDANTMYVNAYLSGLGPNGYCTGAYSLANLAKFNAAVFVCDKGNTAIDATGLYTDRVAQWRKGGKLRWRSISNLVSKFNDKVECQDDRGVHGEGGADKYARNGGTGFGSAAQEINWNFYSSKTIYSGNYLNFLVSNPPVSKTRLLVMQEALTDIVNTTSGINIGLMRFDDDSEGGMVVTPMGPIDTTRAAFITELNDMYHEGGTPLSETLYEAALYYQGKNVDYGNGSQAGYADPNPDQIKLSHPDSRTPSGGAQYKSPIVSECQKNYIVLLTDGEPTSDTGVEFSAARRTAIGMAGNCVGNCLDEIAASIGSTDQSPVGDDQFISTFTIGLELDDPLLKATAQASKDASGQGEYYIADNANSLLDAFTKIVQQVLQAESTFSSPAVSVNAFNRATNLDDLFFTLFKPADGEHWEGNFKKFKLDFLPDLADINGNGDTAELLPVIVDKDGNPAINTAKGFFADGSTSYWTLPADAPDGAKTAVGGAAGMLTNVRKVYTMAGTYANVDGVLTPSDGVLTAAGNALDKSNAAVTDVMLNVVGFPPKVGATPYRDTLLDWAMGIDVLDNDKDGSVVDARRMMGDPLHSEPALVQYGMAGIEPDLVAYVATNDGYLHAFNTIDGTEYFAFVPQEMLPKLDVIFQNDGTNDKQYGLDGNVVPWINDANGDGDLNDAGEHVYLYFGMRRGGRNIYSMDVSNRNAPTLRWVIEGGNGDFAELGETWSTINVEKLNMDGTEKTVLIFGGGYDNEQDNATTRTADTVGRGIFIVNAETGALIWRAGPVGSGADLELANMDYSIPARIKPIDVDGDGFVDRLYTGDMGGQLWRIDIDNSSNGANTVSATGGRIADIAVDADVNDARRFYYPPDAAVIVQEGQAPYISIVAASGYRAHPLNTDIHDRIYMFRDYNVYNTPSPYVTLTEANLYDTTSNIIGEGDQLQVEAATADLNNKKGWFISLNDEDTGSFIGEKGLSEPLILNGIAIVTTFIPVSGIVDAGSCTPNDGTGAVYYISVTDGTPTFDLSSDDTKEREDRKTYLARGGIPPSPTVIITATGKPTLCVGTECEEAKGMKGIQKLYWYEVEQ